MTAETMVLRLSPPEDNHDMWEVCGYHNNTYPIYSKRVDIMSAKDRQVGGKHYKLKIQPIDFIVENQIPFIEANVIKYVTRHREKNGKQDLQKAIHYLEMLIEREYDA